MYSITCESPRWDEVYIDLLMIKKGKLKLKEGIKYLLQSMEKASVSRPASILHQNKKENAQNHIKKAMNVGV